METHDQEGLGHTEEHKLSSGDLREDVLQNGDLSCQKGEMSQNTSLKIPSEDRQTGMSGKRNCNVSEYQDIVVSGRTSPGQGPYECTVCNKSFSGSSNCLQHQRIHTTKKASKCMQCGKSFSRISSLTRHQAVHRGERIFECANCGDRFTRSSSLTLRWRTHEGEKPFVCTQCSRHFSSASELVAHLGLHT
ncbi:PREDICTED: zinc finger protein 271-like [Pygoscelis adeliae]|nr:PREDICTED: zinc finger protein 271-like [Pygoscelis adeliae]